VDFGERQIRTGFDEHSHDRITNASKASDDHLVSRREVDSE